MVWHSGHVVIWFEYVAFDMLRVELHLRVTRVASARHLAPPARFLNSAKVRADVLVRVAGLDCGEGAVIGVKGRGLRAIKCQEVRQLCHRTMSHL
jgi:hypothetical protein